MGSQQGAEAREGQAHEPVHLPRVRELFEPALGGDVRVLVDATVGAGGHAAGLLESYPQAWLLGIDRDEQALERAERALARFSDRVRLVHARYDALPELLAEADCSSVHAVLFDLGISSMQVDEVNRGFSYSRDAPLDMRMDRSTGPTAAEVLGSYSVPELARVISSYGEEPYARRIATAIVKARENAPITTSTRLVRLLYETIPAQRRRRGSHPAKRTFQALRIEVNDELTALRAALPAALDALEIGGRIAVLSYHSLEDRIVKRTLRHRASSRTPAGVPVELAGHGPQLRALTRGAEKAPEAEVERNPRAASVRLRAAERIAESAAEKAPDGGS